MAMSKRQLQKEETRENIIKAAMRLYLRNGFSTTTSRVAQEAGLSHGAIFVHFLTRDDLLLCVLERFEREIGDKLHNLSESAVSVTELLYVHIAVLEKYECFYSSLLSDKSSLPEDAKNTLIGIQSVLSWHFRLVMEQEMKNGTAKDIPLYMLFNTWIGLVHYYLQNADLFAPGESVLNRCKSELVTTFVKLISK
ncbi:TetR/AcrR family transcriptional regulator [Lachnospiraceae bacterium ZAX-1]